MNALKIAYQDFNKRFFSNNLSDTVKVKWLHTNKFCAQVDYGKELIVISDHFKGWGSVWKMHLLHEMAHLAHPEAGHGPVFQQEMRRLARVGAFEGLW